MPESSPTTTVSAGPAPWQQRWYEIIFEADTPAGKAFDVGLLVVILISVAVVMLESVPNPKLEEIHPRLPIWLHQIEWAITLLFSLEFLARIACVAKPSLYTFSFFGIVDLLALLPTYLGLFFGGTHVLATIRTLRLLRVFRIFKMGQHVQEANLLLLALRRTWPKITVFLSVIFCAIVILGTVMYLIECEAGSGFDSIPRSIYWAIVTMTTVGYGDIAPQTLPGQTLAAIIMLFGYAIIIVPTGVFSAEVLSQGGTAAVTCPGCARTSHATKAKFCADCGTKLKH
jgi:voltage-gated potassium channel